MRSIKRISRSLGIGVLGVLALLFILPVLATAFFQIAPHFLKPKVDREIQAIRAKGEPVTMLDLVQPSIPDSQNGAVIYERVFHEMEQPQVAKDMDTLMTLAAREGWFGDPSAEEQVAEIVNRNRALIPLVGQAACKPKCQFHINWQDGPIEVQFPHLAKLRRLAFLLAANAVVCTGKGNMKGAARSIETGLMMSLSLREQPHLISQLARYSQLAVLSSCLRDCARQGRFGSAEALALSSVLSRIDLREGYHLALQGERTTGVTCIELMRTHPRAWADLNTNKTGNYGKLVSSPPEKISAPWCTATYADELFYLRTMRRWIDLSSMSYHDLMAKRLDKAFDPEIPRYALGSAICLPVAGISSWGRGEASVSGDRIFLALIVYKDRFGVYPASIDELRAKLGWKIALDPFSGRDFTYKRQGRGFLLYSIGENLKDDGGREPSGNNRRSREQGDIVWQMDH